MSGCNAGRAKPLRAGWDDLSYDLHRDSWTEASPAAFRDGTIAAMLAAALDDDVANAAPLLATALNADGYAP